jgi:hypothetical protein
MTGPAKRDTVLQIPAHVMPLVLPAEYVVCLHVAGAFYTFYYLAVLALVVISLLYSFPPYSISLSV